jgi:hypothetical protein
MSPYYPLADPPRRTPAGRLGSLREALDDLGQQLRSGVADAVAQTVAGAARDTVFALLSGRHSRPSPTLARLSGASPPPLWGGRDEDLPPDDQEVFSSAWDEPDPEPEPAPPPAASRPPRWVSALSAAWQAGRWWLRRRPGRPSLRAALGVGLAAGLGAFLVASLVPAGVGLLGSALNLAALADVARAGAALLAAVAP